LDTFALFSPKFVPGETHQKTVNIESLPRYVRILARNPPTTLCTISAFVHVTKVWTPPCYGEICLYVSALGTEHGGWTRVGQTPFIDRYDYPVSYIKSNVIDDQIGDFVFEQTNISGYPTQVRVVFYTTREFVGRKFEVWMWESVGGWEKVGEITPTTSWQRHVIDVSTKFNTFAKINEAKMRLKCISG